jgi:hypothetical protein
MRIRSSVAGCGLILFQAGYFENFDGLCVGKITELCCVNVAITFSSCNLAAT